MAIQRVQCTFEKELLEQIDREAKELGLTRSGYLAESARKNMLERSLINALKGQGKTVLDLYDEVAQGLRKDNEKKGKKK